jgi:general nucleoside transport system permease protein
VSDAAASFLEATVRTATPLALAALGELVTERAGVINIGLEGAILAGSFGALVGATYGTSMGYFAGTLAGLVAASVFALFAVRLRANQIVAGTAVTLLALGVTGTLYRAWYGAEGAALSIPTSPVVRIPLLSELPVIGRALFGAHLVTYFAWLLVPLLAWWLHRTHGGLALRASGERAEAVNAAGISAARIRTFAILFGGALGGLSGASLVLAQAGTFAEGMSAGRGFIAIAVVVLGRWHPVGVGLAALLFGAASALQYLFQAMGWPLPYQLFLSLPYVLTLAALAGIGGRTRAPAELGR